MAAPTTMTDLSVTAASNSPAGTDPVGPDLDNFLRAIQAIVRRLAANSIVASATTTDIGAVEAEYLSVSGTTTITGLGTVAAGIRRVLVFEGALTLTHSGTALILPGAASITTAAGDVGIFRSLGSGNWRCESYMKASGAPVGSVPISTGVSGLGTGVATFLATPSSANLLAALTDETGTGSAVFADTPTLVSPILGTPTSGTLTNCSGLPVAGITASTSTALGVGSIELGHATDTTISRVSAGVAAIEGANIIVSGGALGTPASGTLTNCTSLPVSGITASTSTALGVGSIELGHASDTTIARVSAGKISVEGVNVGTEGVVQNSQSVDYTCVLTDAGKHIYQTGASKTITIPANSSVAYPVGTAITFISASNSVTIAITTDTMTLASAGTTGSRTLAANSIATAVKVTSTSWIISGTGLT